MLVRKIISGYVAQVFDTEKKQWFGQMFVPEGVPEYVDENNNPIEPFPERLSYNMVQPSQAYPDGDES